MILSTVSVGQSDYTIAVHGAEIRTNKTPLFVYVNEDGNRGAGCYVYTVGRNDSTYTSVLQQGGAADVHDLACNLGRVLARRFGCPSYVSMSGRFSLHEYLELSRAVVAACEDASA